MRLEPTNIQQIGNEHGAIHWSDSTESFVKLEMLRRACPCAACGGEPDVLGHITRPHVSYTDQSFELVGFDLIGGYALQPKSTGVGRRNLQAFLPPAFRAAFMKKSGQYEYREPDTESCDDSLLFVMETSLHHAHAQPKIHAGELDLPVKNRRIIQHDWIQYECGASMPAVKFGVQRASLQFGIGDAQQTRLRREWL